MITIWKTPIVATVEQVLKDLKLQLYGAGLLKEIKNTGSDLMCTCPFHANGKEHNPSCGVLLQQKVTKDKTYEAGTVHCYTCGYTADLPQFVADLLGLSSPVEGFKWLVNQYNYQTEERDLPDLDMYRGSTAKSSVLEESLVKQYTQNLLQSEEACRYLHKRRIANWVLEAYELGFDPEDKTVLFPVRGMDGKVIFYKGRSIAGKHFYNAKEVDKTSVVFGLWEILNGSFSWGTSDQIEEVWITESEIDALSLISYGVPAVAIMPTLSSIFTFVGNVIQQVLTVIGNHMGLFQTIVSTVVTVVSTVWQALAPVISAVVDLILTVVDGLLTGIETVFNFLAPYIQQIWESICGFFDSASSTITTIVETIKSVFQGLFDAVSTIFGGISDAVSTAIGTVTSVISGAIDAISGFVDKIGGAISKAKDFVGGIGGKVKSALGFAYGKDRVPYDNYPAILHQGEKVLTRNQADQYDRAMSTRGVQLSDVKPIDRDPDPQDDKGGTGGTGNPQDSDLPKSGGIGSVTIEKLADTVIIEKEADTDKVVSDMVAKFKKLLPNMT